MALPTNVNTLDFSFGGEPFCDVPAKTGVDLQTMDYPYQGQPFVSQDTRTDPPLNGQPIWMIPPQDPPWRLEGAWLKHLMQRQYREPDRYEFVPFPRLLFFGVRPQDPPWRLEGTWSLEAYRRSKLWTPERPFDIFPQRHYLIPPQDPPWELRDPWLELIFKTQLMHIVRISTGLSTIVAVPTGGIPNDGIENTTLFITVLYDDGTPVYQATVILSATGTGNLFTQPLPTDINGQAIGYLASTVAEVKTITGAVGFQVIAQQPVVEFVHPSVRRAPPQGNGLQADAANGRWYRVLENEIPVLTSSQFGPTTRPYTFWDAPVQLSKSRNTAWQWQVDTAGVFSVRPAPIERAHIPYFEFISPAGTSFVLQLDDTGAQTLIPFPESLRNKQEWVLANQPGVVYIPDTRFPPPPGVSPR